MDDPADEVIGKCFSMCPDKERELFVYHIIFE